MFAWLKKILKRDKSRASLRKDTRRRKALAWGTFFVVAGLGLAIASVFFEAAKNPEPVVESLGLKWLEHIAIAVFLLGAVGVMLEVRSWSEYFEERLADTIMTDRYLNARGQESLGNHLISVFKAYYARELDYEGSFLEYFRLTLQDQIVAPFREEWRSIITMSKGQNEWLVEEDTIFKCRKVGDSSFIQDSVSFLVDKEDIKGNLTYSVILTLPDNIDENFKDPAGFPKRSGNSYKFPQDHPLLDPLTDDKLGFTLSLKAVQAIDGLHIHLNAQYEAPLGTFHAYAMGFLTKGFEVVIKYPEDLEIKVETLGMHKPQPVVVTQRGLYSVSYGSWLLPDTGVTYLLRERRSDKPASSDSGGKSEEKKAAQAMSILPD